jgi:hypothetical protein
MLIADIRTLGWSTPFILFESEAITRLWDYPGDAQWIASLRHIPGEVLLSKAQKLLRLVRE